MLRNNVVLQVLLREICYVRCVLVQEIRLLVNVQLAARLRAEAGWRRQEEASAGVRYQWSEYGVRRCSLDAQNHGLQPGSESQRRALAPRLRRPCRASQYCEAVVCRRRLHRKAKFG